MRTHRNKIIIGLGVIFLSISFAWSVSFSICEIDKIIKMAIAKERKDDLEKIEEIIKETQSDLDGLSIELKNVNKNNKYYLSDEEKKKLLRRMSDLENDSFRIENFMLVHRNDLTLNFYPIKDLSIDEKINTLWGVHVIVNRLVRNVEDMVLADRIYKYQIKIVQENLEIILDKFKKMKSL